MCLAIPGKIIEISEDQETALIEVVGVRRHVDLRLLDKTTTRCGDWILIHVGFAMSKISEEEAMEQMRTLALLGEADSVLDEVQGYSFGEETVGEHKPSDGDSSL